MGSPKSLPRSDETVAFVEMPQYFPDCCHFPQLQPVCSALNRPSSSPFLSSLSYQQQESQLPAQADCVTSFVSLIVHTAPPAWNGLSSLIHLFKFFQDLKSSSDPISSSKTSLTQPTATSPLRSFQSTHQPHDPVANSWGQASENRWTEDSISLESVSFRLPSGCGLVRYKPEAMSI